MRDELLLGTMRSSLRRSIGEFEFTEQEGTIGDSKGSIDMVLVEISRTNQPIKRQQVAGVCHERTRRN